MKRPRLFRKRSLTRRQKMLTLVPTALVALVVVGLYFLLRPSPPPPAVIRRADAYTISAPAEIGAGERFMIAIDGIEISESLLYVDVVSPWGSRRLEAVPVEGKAVLEVPNDIVEQSGTLRLVAHTSIGEATTTLMVNPGEVVDRMTPLAGPRSVVADTKDWTMVVLLPRDRFGNIVAEGTPTTLRARRPNGDEEAYDAEVRNLLTWMRVFSGTLAGRTTVRADVGGQTGAEIEVLEVAGPPVPFELRGPELDGRADGRTLVTIETEQLRDQYDNVLPDGTSVVFRTTGSTGREVQVASTIGGRATVRIESPTVAGDVTIQAHVGEVLSEALVVKFNGDVSRLDLVATYNPAGTRVEVGPVLSVLGGFVPDGTQVTIRSSMDEVTTSIDDGRATVTIATAADDVIEVELLGTRATAELKK
jgi:hypothetical protein